MFLKKANMDDLNDVWLWYSDPLSRKMSINQDSVNFENHCKWYKDNLNDPHNVMYIGFNDKHKIGFSRFDSVLNEQFTFVSITLGNNFRGKNLSKSFLKMSIDFFLSENNTILKAKIKSDNISSIKCFKGCNFKLSDVKDNYQIYTKTF